jgi:hypothetical protein
VGLPHLIDQGTEPLAGFCGGHGCHGPVRLVLVRETVPRPCGSTLLP